MKLLIFLSCIAFGHASQLDVCSYGESFWCSSIRTAKQCGAFQHCMDTVWKNDEPIKDTTNVCEFCEAIIKDVRTFVDDKDNQQQVKTFLDNACNIIPDETLANLCKTELNNNFEELIKMIDSELVPATVCSAWGLCTGFKDLAIHPDVEEAEPQLVQSAGPKANDDPICPDCEKFVKDLKAKMTSPSEEKEVEKMIEDDLCSMTGQYADMCKVAVETYMPELFQMLASEVDPVVICKSLGFCPADTNSRKVLAQFRLKNSDLFKAASKYDGTEECLLCKTVLAELQDLDRDAKVQADVEDFLKNNLCALMGSLKDICMTTVDQYAPEIFELLVNELDPEVRCRSLGFCPATKSKDPVREATPVKKVGAGPTTECVLCEFVIKEVDGMLSDNATEKEIIAALDQICNDLPDTIKETCSTFVDQYGPTVIALLLQELDPQQVCTKLGLCTSFKASVNRVGASTECVLCEFVIKEIDSILGDKKDEKAIVSALNQVCGVLPDSVKAECTTFVEQYAPTLIALLMSELDPAQICTKLGLCQSSLRKVQASTECILCEFIMQEVDSILKQNATQSEIMGALDKVCSILPASISSDCTDFVDTYGPAVIALLEQELEPSTICSLLGLCAANKKAAKPTLFKFKKARVADDEMCGICETVIQYLDSLLEENSTIQEIEKVLFKVCNFLPDNIKKECTDIVGQYGPAIIGMIAEFADPKEICTEVGLCSNATRVAKSRPVVKMEKLVPAKANLVGTNQCTWGPAYWCASSANAKQCNAEAHCQKHVWLN